MADSLNIHCIVTECQTNGLSVMEEADQWALRVYICAFSDIFFSMKKKKNQLEQLVNILLPSRVSASHGNILAGLIYKDGLNTSAVL